MSLPLGLQNQKIPIDGPSKAQNKPKNPFEFIKGLILYFYMVYKIICFFQKNPSSNFMEMSQILKQLLKKMVFTQIKPNL